LPPLLFFERLPMKDPLAILIAAMDAADSY
jgi:hypothetical protein